MVEAMPRRPRFMPSGRVRYTSGPHVRFKDRKGRSSVIFFGPVLKGGPARLGGVIPGEGLTDVKIRRPRK